MNKLKIFIFTFLILCLWLGSLIFTEKLVKDRCQLSKGTQIVKGSYSSDTLYYKLSDNLAFQTDSTYRIDFNSTFLINSIDNTKIYEYYSKHEFWVSYYPDIPTNEFSIHITRDIDIDVFCNHLSMFIKHDTKIPHKLIKKDDN